MSIDIPTPDPCLARARAARERAERAKTVREREEAIGDAIAWECQARGGGLVARVGDMLVACGCDCAAVEYPRLLPPRPPAGVGCCHGAPDAGATPRGAPPHS